MRSVQAGRALMAGLLVVSASGCVGWRVANVPPRELLSEGRVEAVRVTRADKSKVEIYNPTLVGDSIIGHPTDRAIAKLVMPLSQVETIATQHKSIGKTMLAVLTIGGALGAYALLQSLNQGY